ncbi:helix-turn-helix domain-containing protein [Algivirga pacifica]|uniref:ATP-binding protein n=1 Tax=Algivirga pacifica TaxID=1162670 RepID=A0ABP9DII5_9BACT
MLSKEDVENIIQSGEGYNAEFKERLPKKLRELSEEVCAFANAAGGVVLIGVDDDNQVQRVTMDNAKRSALQNSLNEITPNLHCPIYAVVIEGREVWVIEVDSGNNKPYVLSGVIYVRQGPNTQKLTTVEQMRDFFQQADKIYFDEAPCREFSVEKDIDEEWFEEFRLEAGLSKAITRQQIINNLKVTTPDGSVKNGGVLFFGESPEHFFDTAAIRCIAFEGTTKTNIIDDKRFGGPLVNQYKQALQWLKSKLSVRYIIEDAGPRKEQWEIPEVALKEAIMNALAHRDYYDKGSRIVIELFEDRLEVTNPGGLVSAIKPDEFGFKSHSRNPLLFGLLVRINMVEQIGSGIRRMQDVVKEAGLPVPVFKTEGLFTVIFSRVSVDESSGESSGKSSGKNSMSWENTKQQIATNLSKKLSKSAWMILELVYENKDITIPEMAEQVGISERAIQKNIQKLKEEQLLERVGPDKGGYWKIC